MTTLFDPDAIAAHDRAFAAAYPDWDEVHGSRRLIDPVVCLARRESPDDGAPLCGAWLSEHCPECGCCPGLHADDRDHPGRTVT